jgi:hypothetical protein
MIELQALAVEGVQGGLHFLPVLSDNMEPELRVGRHMVLVQPASEWNGEGMYVLEAGVIYQCDAVPGSVAAYSFNPAYSTKHRFTRADFAQAVTGKVVASIKLHDADAQDRLWAAVRCARQASSLREVA